MLSLLNNSWKIAMPNFFSRQNFIVGATITIEVLFTKKKIINAILLHTSNFLKSGAQVLNIN